MDNKYNISIILTTTVNVTKHTAFQVDITDRVNTYLKSIRLWLKNTKFNIIVVENSGYNFEELNDELNIYNDRFEIISFTENPQSYSSFQMHLQSKGGLEINSIHYAYDVSKFLKKSSFIFDRNLFIANGKYDFHVENVYAYRFSLCKNVLVCPIFDIEPTQRGGLNEIYTKL